MQITNNTTTIELNEEKILNLIIDQRIVKLEQIFETIYKVPFKEIPVNAYYAHLYLCVVELGLKQSEITDIYEIGNTELQRIIKACHTKQLINKAYKIYLYKIHLQCSKINIAA